MTLSTNTPRDFFAKHQLLLHVAKSEMDKVRVFHASRESSSAVPSVSPSHPRHSPFAPPSVNNSRARYVACSEDQGCGSEPDGHPSTPF